VIALLALTLLAYLVRAWHLDVQSLWRDEVDVIRFAGESVDRLLVGMTLPQHNGPLYYLLMRGWLNLAGESEFALRYVSLCSSVLSVPLAWRVARPLVGQRSALLTALLVAISAYLVWYAQDAKMYALIGALALLSMACWWRTLTGHGARWSAGFVVSTGLGLYIHLLSALLLPAYAAIAAITWPRWRARWRTIAVSLGLLTLPYLPLAVWQLPLVWNTHVTGHSFVRLDEMVSVLFSLYAGGMAMVAAWPALLVLVFALLMGIFGPVLKNDPSATRRHRLVLVTWCFLPVLLLFLVSLRVPLFEPRYLLFTAPPLLMLVAHGIVALVRLSRSLGSLVLAAVVAFNCVGIGVQAVHPLKSDFRSAAAFVADRYQEGEPIMFQVPYVRYVFDYYFRDAHPTLDGPWTNDGKNEASVAHLMAAAVDGHRTLWLVSSESWLWDERGLTRAWLEAHAEALESATFSRVEVYRYQLADGDPPAIQ
jgi:hypothetical protein